MSLRNPLVKFEAPSRAQLVSYSPFLSNTISEEEERNQKESTSTPPKKSSGHSRDKKLKKRSSHPTKTKKKKQSKRSIHKGQLTVTLPGYKGEHKVLLSKLVSCLANKHLKQAAKKVLLASGALKGLKKKKRKARIPTNTQFVQSLLENG